MPFLKESMIQYLIKKANEYDVIVPRTEDGLQPLHAVYSKNCLEPIKNIIGMGKYKIIDFYPLVKTKIIEESEFISLDINLNLMRESFVNINTPGELNFLKERKLAS
jgi:molybdopterin-guanine dinucleotide biosynthesis protein A